jgi:hypothetical protein
MRIYTVVLITAWVCVPLIGDNARLSPRYRTVYVTEMADGLDQHLANRLTSSRVLWVVLEPASADSVLTDTLDDSFWDWLASTYPARPGAPASTTRGMAARRDPRTSSRHVGTVFLVDPRTRVVLWSAYEYPKNSSSIELNRTAERIVKQLKEGFGKK